MNNKSLQPYFLLLLLLGSVVLAYFIFSPFLIPLALAAFFAVALESTYARVLRAVGNPSAAAALMLLGSVICIAIPLSIISVLISRDAQQLYISLSDGTGRIYLFSALQNVQVMVHTYAPHVPFPTNLYESIDGYTRGVLAWVMSNLGVIFSSVASILLLVIIFGMTFFYLLRDGAAFKRALIELSPLEDADNEAIFKRLEQAVNSTIRGSLITGGIQGLVAWLGLFLFGVPNSVLWALVAAVASLIPGIGTMLVMLPAAVFLFLIGSNLAALGLFLWGLLFVSTIDNFVRPKLVGKGMQLHPLIVLLSVLGGLAYFGPAGIFLGPLCISLLFAVLAIHTRTTQKTKKSVDAQ